MCPIELQSGDRAGHCNKIRKIRQFPTDEVGYLEISFAFPDDDVGLKPDIELHEGSESYANKLSLCHGELVSHDFQSQHVTW